MRQLASYPRQNGVAAALVHLEEGRLANVRLHHGDALEVLEDGRVSVTISELLRNDRDDDGDRIRVDIAGRTLDVQVAEEELEARRREWTPVPPKFTTGVLGKYAKLVRSAAEGAYCG